MLKITKVMFFCSALAGIILFSGTAIAEIRFFADRDTIHRGDALAVVFSRSPSIKRSEILPAKIPKFNRNKILKTLGAGALGGAVIGSAPSVMRLGASWIREGGFPTLRNFGKSNINYARIVFGAKAITGGIMGAAIGLTSGAIIVFSLAVSSQETGKPQLPLKP